MNSRNSSCAENNNSGNNNVPEVDRNWSKFCQEIEGAITSAQRPDKIETPLGDAYSSKRKAPLKERSSWKIYSDRKIFSNTLNFNK